MHSAACSHLRLIRFQAAYANNINRPRRSANEHVRGFDGIARQAEPRRDVVAVAGREKTEKRFRADGRFDHVMKRPVAAERHDAATTSRDGFSGFAPQIFRARRKHEIAGPLLLAQIIRDRRLNAPRPAAAGDRIDDNQGA